MMGRGPRKDLPALVFIACVSHWAVYSGENGSVSVLKELSNESNTYDTGEMWDNLPLDSAVFLRLSGAMQALISRVMMR